MNKSALIIGGSGGIGSHLVKQFCLAGYDVVFTYNTGSSQAGDMKKIRGGYRIGWMLLRKRK